MSFVWKKILAGALAPSALLCAAPGAPPPAPRPQGSATPAAALYRKHCATCHGKDGRAQTFKAKFNKARDLTVAPWQETVTDDRLFNSITHGLRRMPAFGKKLNQRQIESLVAHVRALKK
jgi:cytochrome c